MRPECLTAGSLSLRVDSGRRLASFRSPFPAGTIVPYLPWLSVLLFLCVAVGRAQTRAEPLNLPQCIELARNAPSTVQRAREQLKSAQFGVHGAEANFLPQVSIVNGFTYNSPLLYDRNQFSFIALNGVREYSSVADTSLELDSSGRLRAIYDRARADRSIAEANVIISERDLRQAVSMAYYRALLTKKLLASAEENQKAAHDFETKVQQLVEGGEASRADLAQASVESALLDQTAASMSIEAEQANHDLASYWTTDVQSPLNLANDLDQMPPPIPDALGNQVYLKRPEFQLFTNEITGYRADARQARARMLPQINFDFQYGIDSLQVTGRNRGYMGAIHLNIPVFDFLRAHDEERQFQSLASQAEIDQSIGARALSKAYQDALSQVKGIFPQIDITARQVASAKENLRLSRLRFEGGEGPALDVVTAESAVVQSEINFYTTRANYLNALVAFKVASGQ